MNGGVGSGAMRWRGLTAGTLVVAAAAALSAQAPAPVLTLSPERAVTLALDQNLALRSVRMSQEAADLDARAADAAWTPSVSASVVNGHAQTPTTGSFDQRLSTLSQRQLSSGVALSQQLPWGTSYQVGWNSARRASNSAIDRYQPQLSAGASVTVVQPLLRNLGFDPVRAARDISAQGQALAASEIDAAVATTTRSVLYAYWQWVYLRDLLEVERDALRLAQTLLDGNRVRVAAGAMAAVDVVEAEAEVARRGEAIIVAAKDAANAEDRLRMLITSPGSLESSMSLEPDAQTANAAIGARSKAGVSDRAARALSDRSDLNDLRTSASIDRITERRYRNDTLPDTTLTFDYSLQGTGGTEVLRDGGIGTPVTGTFERGFGSVLNDVGQFRFPSWSVQLAVGYPLGTAPAEANAARTRVLLRQKEAAVAALEQQVVTEVSAAEREVDANQQRLESTATAVALAQRRLEAEERKFAVGLSTSFFVFQAQRDLSSAREAQLRSRLDHRLSLADLEAVQRIPLQR